MIYAKVIIQKYPNLKHSFKLNVQNTKNELSNQHMNGTCTMCNL